jgi:hypothetical protein
MGLMLGAFAATPASEKRPPASPCNSHPKPDQQPSDPGPEGTLTSLVTSYGKRGSSGVTIPGTMEGALSDNPYDVLGVKPSASRRRDPEGVPPPSEEVSPGSEPWQSRGREQFKRVTAAYDLLGDPEKRARFERGEIDASGAERPSPALLLRLRPMPALIHPYASRAGFEDFMGSG